MIDAYATGATGATGASQGLRVNALMLAYWASLGATAGGLGGFLVGGVGGRLAMFVLRLTSPDGVRGVTSDDGFTIGRFDLPSTLSLLAVTAVLGAIAGVVVVAGRPFFRSRFLPLAWGIAGGAIGGAIIVHSDGVDFTALEPTWFAIALFVAIPGAGAALIAWLVELLRPYWWRERRLTIATAFFGLPILIAFPVAIAVIVVCAALLIALQSGFFRRNVRGLPARVAAWLVFGGITAAGVADLAGDARALL